ncbi:uncharacterized protein J7T54_005170 [Emericellopsis cladophorae]|uniref:Uncharacterized protein n=1 Tax=Emericellopsis cladophorae TaxID=2686198 RepID=A0A9P9Y1S2_9HYPO|nr:uncharacterized protein J7T54_005170 [Emericellopsis cladophorae]KAI6781959.1 hypothetical protein J7T54_005170 [Emericellopsis cladophorae]
MEQQGAFEDFVSLIGKFCAGKSYPDLKAVFEGNETLKKQLDETETAYRRNLKELSQLFTESSAEKGQLEQKIREQERRCSKAMEEKVTAYRKLNAEQGVVMKLTDKVKSLNDDIKKRVETNKKSEDRVLELHKAVQELETQVGASKKEEARLKNELQAVGEKLRVQKGTLTRTEEILSQIQAYMTPLGAVESERENISEMMLSSFKDAVEVFKASLSHDLDNRQLQDKTHWEQIKHHSAVQGAIPLPTTNSIAAKRMRAIVGLSIYSKALDKHIFRSTFFPLGPECDNILDTLPTVNPDQDALVRAVLLKVAPEEQDKHREHCVERTVNEVASTFAGWLSTDQRSQFRSRLDNLTRKITTVWQRVQKLNERVKPHFVLDALDDWLPLSKVAAGLVPTDHGVKTAPSRQESANGQTKTVPGALTADDIVRVVWPAFVVPNVVATNNEECPTELVYTGYVLTRDDVQSAADEELPQRVMRRATRNGSTPAQKKRRDSVSFLSPVAFSESNGK